MVSKLTFGGRADWLAARKNRVGGSECAALVGMHPYTDNVRLWLQKTWQEPPPAVDNDAVRYGAAAEEHIRVLFALDHPEYVVTHADNAMVINDRYPFAHASLDGELIDQNDRLGVLEIKTGQIGAKWRGKVPDNYYCQLLWYLAVTEYDFAVLRAYLRTPGDDTIMRDYYIDRADVEGDIAELMGAGERFWHYVQTGQRPPLILPAV